MADAQMKTELDKVHGNTAPTLKTVYFWIDEFKRGRISTKDEACPGRSVDATMPEIILKTPSHRHERSQGNIMQHSKMLV